MSVSSCPSPPGPRPIGRRLSLLAAGGLAVLQAACSGPASSVEGLVTLDGRPLPAARISFHPDAAGPVAYGISLADGSYQLKTGATNDGLEPGSYRVTVFAMEVVAGAEEKAGSLLTPEVYGDRANTPLRCEVAPGSNQIPLALETAPRASVEKP